MPTDPNLPDLVLMREQFQSCVEAETPRRKLMLEAKKFSGGDQWPQAIKDLREGNGASGITASGPRPCLTIDRISQPIQQVVNQIKGAHFGVEVSPNGGGASDEVAEIYEGYFRRMQNRARAEDPTGWAAEDGVVSGLGWFGLNSEYCNDEDDTQDLCQERIDNSLSVYTDPSAVPPTFKDSRFAFVTEHLTKSACLARWEDFDGSSLEDFTSTGDNPGLWANKDTVTIVKWWRVVHTAKKLKSGRTVQVPEVRWSICCATQVLEGYGLPNQPPKTGIWAGKRIPLFPVVGKLRNIDGDVLMTGMVYPAIDAQRMVNYMYSGAVELTALSSKDPIVVDPAAIEGWEMIWQRAQVDSLALIPARSFHPDNPSLRFEKPYKMGASSQIGAMVEMLVRSEEGIKATTGIFDANLGKENSRDKSGRAILALQQQGDAGNSNWIEAYKNALIAFADEVIVALPHYLDTPGRILEILDKNEDAQRVMLNQPFTRGPNGQPQPVLNPQTQQPVMDPEEAKRLTDGVAKFLDLKKGQYVVTAKVGKAKATQLDAANEAMGQLIEAAPEYMIPRIADVYVESLSFPGHMKIAERLKMGNPFAKDQNQQTADLQSVQAENEQLKAQMQDTQQLADKNKTDLEKVKLQEVAESERRRAELDSKEAMNRADNETRLAVAELGAKVDRLTLFLEERNRIGVQLGDQAEAAAAREHEVGMAGMQHQQGLEASQVGHEQALEQAQTPPPIDPNAQLSQGAE